jgi:glycogen synthase
MNTLCILHVASELAPLTGNGLLAREVSYLSSAMAELGLDVTVAVPGHRIPEPTSVGLARRLRPLLVPGAGPATEPAPGATPGATIDAFESTVHEGKLAGGRVKVLALDVPAALRQGVQQGTRAFCHAVMTAAVQAGLRPDAVFVWPGTEPAAAMARAAFRGDQTPVTLMALRDQGDAGALAQAIEHIDLVVASSPSRAEQVRALPETDPLGRVLASRRDAVHGILGGIDTLAWNPPHDGLDTRDLAASKAEHKRRFKRRLGLRGGAQAPLLALIGPFDDDILTEAAAEELALCDTLLVVLADAERDRAACERFQHLARRGRGVLLAVPGQDELRSLEHELLCAADIALFARRHPNTALSELHAMHYGVAPVAPRGPVYSDLLLDFEARTGTGSGFLFDPGADKPGSLATAVERALRAYHQPRAFQALIERCARFDLSWRTAAIRHTELLVETLRPRQALAVTPSHVPSHVPSDVHGDPQSDVHGDTAAASAS